MAAQIPDAKVCDVRKKILGICMTMSKSWL